MCKKKTFAGGYAYIDTSHPRRPGDRAVLYLVNDEHINLIENGPKCLSFWVSRFGSSVGELR